MYVPQPLLVRPATNAANLTAAATDVLALSKMNWNNAQLDERDSATKHRYQAPLPSTATKHLSCPD
jgi:hypothetical protein